MNQPAALLEMYVLWMAIVCQKEEWSYALRDSGVLFHLQAGTQMMQW